MIKHLLLFLILIVVTSIHPETVSVWNCENYEDPTLITKITEHKDIFKNSCNVVFPVTGNTDDSETLCYDYVSALSKNNFCVKVY